MSESWVSLTNEKYWEGLSAHSEMENGFTGIEKLSVCVLFAYHRASSWDTNAKGIPTR